jgi:hypothetical protein
MRPATPDGSPVDRLIDLMDTPVRLPGLELRAAPPATAPSSPDATQDGEGGRPRFGDAGRPPTVQPTGPQPLDIDAVADRVYRKLSARWRLERERRGRS